MRWPNLALIAGGLLMIPMWVRFTTLHGPTSFDEDGHWLGQSPGFWGSMMAPTMLLIVPAAPKDRGGRLTPTPRGSI